MSSPVLTAAQLVAAPVAAGAIGSVVAAVRPPSPSVTSALQHVAAGVVMAAVAGEVLPDLRDKHSLRAALLGFAVGIAAVLTLAAIERRAEARPTGTVSIVPRVMIATIAIDLLIDGILVGMGASLGEGTGRTLAIALAFEVCFLGMSLTAELLERGLPRTRAMSVPMAASLPTIIGAFGGAALLGHASPALLSGVLAFGCAALLYLVTEELLTEAHDVPDTNIHVIMFFVGFLFLYALEGIN